MDLLGPGLGLLAEVELLWRFWSRHPSCQPLDFGESSIETRLRQKADF